MNVYDGISKYMNVKGSIWTYMKVNEYEGI